MLITDKGGVVGHGFTTIILEVYSIFFDFQRPLDGGVKNTPPWYHINI